MNTGFLQNNLLTIANHIHHGVNCFSIEEVDGIEVIKTNNFIRRHLLYPFFSGKSHENRIEYLISKNVQLASQLGYEQFIIEKTKEPTDLFIAVQKYNQTIAKAQAHKLKSNDALANRVRLGIVKNDKVSQLNPTKILAITNQEIADDLKKDKPEITTERRLLKKYQIRRYPGDRIDHSKEAGSIFFSTQKERLLSAIGRVIEAAGRIFGFEVTAFQKYHYRKNNESDEQIFSQATCPFNLACEEPTSYWLGHATLFLSVPLKSEKGTVANFHVYTDPVEEDLNSILYPRQTKFARPIEKMPAPDVYLLSHNHLDHYSKETIKKIFAQQPVMIVPKGDGSRYINLAKELGFDYVNIIEMDWWEQKEITFEKNGERFTMKITATPARHWSGQGPCGGHESTFLGYVIRGNKGGDIYFAGDTARLNEDHVQKLKENFNIRWNFQPGGPDEVRKDMESTHQASVDGLWMHFKTMVPRIYEKGMQKDTFLERARKLKTIYMHTMTFKLGNLHISDTKESLEKVLNALDGKSPELKSYEKQVYDELCQIAAGLEFANGVKLSPSDISKLLAETVIVPKIGSRLGLAISKTKQVESTYF